MICLTGDVHHSSLMTNDQRQIADPDLTEIGITEQYVDLLAKYDVRCTLYVCGRCFTEEWEELEPVVRHPLVEVGGHMFNARFPRECFDAYGEQTGITNNPEGFHSTGPHETLQSRMIQYPMNKYNELQIERQPRFSSE